MERDIGGLLRLLDYFTAMLTGAGSALLVHYLIPSGWPAVAGMVSGMLIGLPFLLLVMMGFIWIGGDFQIIMPGMPIVMITGMGGGMMAAAGDTTTGGMAAFGIVTGLVLQTIFRLYDISLHGEVALDEQAKG